MVARASGASVRRFVAGASVFLAVMVAPPPKVHLQPAQSKSRPDVVLLSIDALGREGLDSIVSRVTRTHPRDLAGGIYYRRVVSQTPLTRLSWLGVLSGKDPSEYGETQFVGSQTSVETEEGLGRALPDTLRTLGYLTAHLSDWSETSRFSRRWFDLGVLDARGWQSTIRTSMHSGTPVLDLLYGKWRGSGLATQFGSGRPRQLWSRVFGLLTSNRRPVFVASHTVVMHTPLNLDPFEFPSLQALARISPGSFLSIRTQDQARRRSDQGGSGMPSWRELFSWRRQTAVKEAADLLAEIARSGLRKTSLVIVFSDHGEAFAAADRSGTTTAGIHGFGLDPALVGVSMLVLPPSPEEAAPLRIDTTHSISLYDIPAIVLRAVSGDIRPAEDWTPNRLMPLHAGAALSGASDGFSEPERLFFPLRRFTSALQFFRDGDYIVDSGTIAAMDSCSPFGWSAGEALVEATPLVHGRYRIRWYRGGSVSSTAVAASAVDAERFLGDFRRNQGEQLAARRDTMRGLPRPAR
jgi:hypothetical protein